MAGVPISLLPQGTLPYTGTEQFAFVQAGETRTNNFQSLVSFYEDYFVTYDLLGSLSGNWQATYLALEVRGALWDVNYSVTSTLSSNWNSVYTTVSANSANWGSSNNFCGETVYLETVDPCAGTGDTITINANLDIQGFSINNIGNSSLNFESGAKISSNTNGGVLILPNPSNIPGKWGTAIGLNNSAPAAQSLASGKNTTASGDMSMAHGLDNSAGAPYSIAAGGRSNIIDPLGVNSAILGGKNNRISVSDSTAVGTYAQSLSHAGSFVFADGSTTAAFTPVSANSFNIKAAGGLRFVDGLEAPGRVLTCDAEGTGHWADPTGGSGANVTVQGAPPVPANVGDLWFNDNTGILYIYYDDFWVDASAGSVTSSTGDFCSSTVYMNALSACGPSNTISLTGDLDLNGGSILNVGNNSLTFESGASIGSDVEGNIVLGDNTNLTNVDVLCASTIHTLSSFTHYQDIIVSELSGFAVTGDVNIDGDVEVTGVLSGSGGTSTQWNAAYSVAQEITGLNNYIEDTPNVHHTALIGGEGLSATGFGQDSFLGGGSSNRVESYASGIIGGEGNITSGDGSFLAGGNYNTCDGYGSTIIGSNGTTIDGVNNSAIISTAGGAISGSANESIIIGGENNVIHQTGYISAIVGGDRCEINKPYSFASGRKAIVNHNRARVFADGSDTVFTSLSDNEFAIQASGLRLDDGNQAAGRVLTCDVSGTGTWQDVNLGNSGNWDSAYTTVSSNSANWDITPIAIACSDETTDLTTGTAKTTFRMPYAMNLTEVRASVNTAPVGNDITVDINEGGASILDANKLTIDDGSKTSVGSSTAYTITDTALADDAEITIDIDAVGSTTAGKGLKIWLIGVKA